MPSSDQPPKAQSTGFAQFEPIFLLLPKGNSYTYDAWKIWRRSLAERPQSARRSYWFWARVSASEDWLSSYLPQV